MYTQKTFPSGSFTLIGTFFFFFCSLGKKDENTKSFTRSPSFLRSRTASLLSVFSSLIDSKQTLDRTCRGRTPKILAKNEESDLGERRELFLRRRRKPAELDEVTFLTHANLDFCSCAPSLHPVSCQEEAKRNEQRWDSYVFCFRRNPSRW